jgi:hypothetical protein
LIAYAILGLALLAGAILIARWFVSAEPRQVLRVLRWTAAVLAVLFILFVLFIGRQALIVMALPFLIPLAMRMRHLRGRLKTMRGPSPGQTSEVATRFLRMTLDHDSGEMDGLVLEGRHAGRRLGQLPLESLLELYRDYLREDEESLSVLEAYLDRVHGETWREQAQAGAGGGASASMTREEAYEILGLEPGASPEEIRAAHRRLMQHAHPDHGGSNYLAAKINQAKDLLLGE